MKMMIGIKAERITKNSALYYEICMLKTLLKMGYINKAAYEKIVEIAAEDYNSTLYLK